MDDVIWENMSMSTIPIKLENVRLCITVVLYVI